MSGYGERNTKRAWSGFGGVLIHLLCPCGVPVAITPGEPGSEVICRSCGASNALPPPRFVASIRREYAASGRSGTPGSSGSTAGTIPTSPAPPAVATAPLPEFGSDERLDLGRLDGTARQAGALARVSLAAGFSGALLGVLLVPGEPAVRALAGVVPLLCGLLAWAAYRAIRTNALATLVLAERQRDVLRLIGARNPSG